MGLNYLASLSHFIPELIVCGTMFILILVEAFYREEWKDRRFFFGLAFVGLVSAFVFLVLNLNHGRGFPLFANSLIIDPFSTLLKMIMLGGTFASIYLVSQSKDIAHNLKPEFTIMVVGVLVGGMLLSSANNMLLLYIGVETLSILSYVLASLKKSNTRSSEAGLKYSLYGGLSAGIMLFGLSHIFGALGTINFFEMARELKTISTLELAVLLPSFLLFLAGLGYKIACVPFHMWSPDVYEGSPIPVTTFFSVVPKVAGLAALMRISLQFFSGGDGLTIGWVGVLSIVSALTMTIGNISAIGQKSVKRMLAYSSISHAGVMLLGILVVSEVGVSSVIFYAITYLFMNLVAFYIVSFVSDKYGNDHFERFNGLIYRYPFMAIMMGIAMLSLAGIPPFAGFVAKFHIFNVIILKKYYVLAVIAGLNSVISMYYYMRIVRLMTLRPAEAHEKIAGFGPVNQGIIVGLTIPVIFLGLFWEKVMLVASSAKLFLE